MPLCEAIVRAAEDGELGTTQIKVSASALFNKRGRALARKNRVRPTKGS